MSREDHRIFECRPNLRYAQLVTARQLSRAAVACRQIDVVHLPQIRRQNTLQLPGLCVGVRQQSTGDVNCIRHGGLRPEFVDRGTSHRPVDRYGFADGRNENDVAGQQLPIIARIASQQQIIQIEGGDQAAVAFELYVAQRTDLLHAAAHEQRIRHGRQAAHRIGARLFSVSQHEHADRSNVTHGDANARADELLRYAMFDRGPRRIETHVADHDRTELGKIHPAVSLNGQLIERGLVAINLNLQRVAGTDDIVDRHLYV